ncbi:MAG: LysR family transcriptional regulator [Lachnospiraceae bacterium]|nr:LysR family transcriptional regulator [Lachnospiraceae bacterium]
MNTNQLRYFVAAAESKSFTKAAEQYYISQTAITQQIRALEDTLGVALFDRSSRPISLTPAGRTFLTDARAILERMDNAMHRVQEASVGMVGNLCVGYTKGYERNDRTNDMMKQFHRKYPNVLVSCYRRNTDFLAAGLLKGEFDIIFTWDSTELMKNNDVECVLVERSPLMVSVYGNHPLARRKSIRRQELKNDRILFMTPSSNGESVGDLRFYEKYEEAGYQPNIIFRSNDAESILMMIAAEEGISILPAYVTQKLINAENIVFIPLIGEGEVVEIIAAWKKENGNVVLQQFIEQFQNERIEEN